MQADIEVITPFTLDISSCRELFSHAGRGFSKETVLSCIKQDWTFYLKLALTDR